MIRRGFIDIIGYRHTYTTAETGLATQALTFSQPKRSLLAQYWSQRCICCLYVSSLPLFSFPHGIYCRYHNTLYLHPTSLASVSKVNMWSWAPQTRSKSDFLTRHISPTRIGSKHLSSTWPYFPNPAPLVAFMHFDGQPLCRMMLLSPHCPPSLAFENRVLMTIPPGNPAQHLESLGAILIM